jgi:hypothetical protein
MSFALTPEETRFDRWQVSGDTAGLARFLGLKRRGHLQQESGAVETFYAIDLEASRPERKDRILRLAEEAFADFLEGRTLRPEYFELPPPQITGSFIDRTVGLRVGTARYGARVAGYEWDREGEVFRLTSVHYPELFEALIPPEEE